MYYLMIKEIEQTGLKYLCKRKQYKDPYDHIKYRGSGKWWLRTLNAHPEYTLKTTVLGLYDKDDLIKYGLYYSNLYNIVESTEWANLMPEVGDGGATNTGKHPFRNIETGQVVYKQTCPEGYEPYYNLQKPCKVIHNPTTGQLRKINPKEQVPEGWVIGGIKGKYSYGPTKGNCKVYNNGERKIYLPINSPVPDGFVPGLHYQGTTKNRIGCYHPVTLEKRYVINKDDIPPDFVRGVPPTTSKKIQTPHGEFSSIVECMGKLNLTRYQIKCNIKKYNDWFFKKD
jgi:hypothetical protein